MTKPFNAASADLFFSKNDPQDLRLGDLVKPVTFNSDSSFKNTICICGYPDDEGIHLNGGRIGAAQGPTQIRRFLYRMTPPPNCAPASLTTLALHDIGDLPVHSSLEDRHRLAEDTAFQLQSQQAHTLSFGGGHDYGFPDASGFLKAHLAHGQRPVVLNFDAHLDVRPSDKGFNSGTPFHRLLTQYEGQFDFIEVGIQPQCNSASHLNWARSKGALIYDLESCNQQGLAGLFQLAPMKKLHSHTPVFISFDIDALPSSEAPGCSQSWTTGLPLKDCLAFFSQLKKQASIRGLGIYEVSPPLDFDHHTAKAAALIAYHFLFQDILP